MDFVAVMLLTQQVFHLECLLFFNSFCYLRLFQIKSQPGVAYKSVVYKNHVTLFIFEKCYIFQK